MLNVRRLGTGALVAATIAAAWYLSRGEGGDRRPASHLPETTLRGTEVGDAHPPSPDSRPSNSKPAHGVRRSILPSDGSVASSVFTEGADSKGLTDAQRRDLYALLDRAERSDVLVLVDALLQSLRADDDRELELNGWLFAWAIARRPADLARLRDLILLRCTTREEVEAVLLCVGMAGTPEARATLLRWLHDPVLRCHEALLLSALHQTPSASQAVMEWNYSEFLRVGPKQWSTSLRSNSQTCLQREVLEATIQRLSPNTSEDVRRLAASILHDVNDPGRLLSAKVDADLQGAMDKAFWSMFLESRDGRLHHAAKGYLCHVTDPEVQAAFWDMFKRATADSEERPGLAWILVQQARTLAQLRQFGRFSADSGPRSRRKSLAQAGGAPAATM